MKRRWWTLALALALCACEGAEQRTDGSVGDAGAGAPCSAELDCDDGAFCNGAERCAPEDPSADGRGCAPASTGPCAMGEACDEAADRCGASPACAGGGDADGDGHVAIACGGDDCDDLDPERFPGNPEVCDPRGHDEDCDPSTVGPDADGDSFIGASCCNRRPDGSLSCGADCDDTNGSAHPGVTDGCNLTDDDCDGLVDEDPATLFYRDLDGDGFGRPDDPEAPAEERAVRACGGGPGYSPFDTDCDDGSRAVNPAAFEVCADGIDNNCDGVQDADPERPGFACACTAPGEERPCGGGDVNEPPAVCRLGVQTCQSGGIWSACLGDVSPQTERCNGSDDDCDGAVDEGVQVVCYADPDGDGYAAGGEAARELCPVAGREAVGGCPVRFADVAPLDAASIDCVPSEARIHPGAADVCDAVDGDCDGAIDEGGSDAGCTDETAWGRCARGSCALLSCRFGRGDCNGLPSDGCETDTRSDARHCGTCGQACPLGASCDRGVCVDGFVDVAAGPHHTCALATDQSVHCWGGDGAGQLGDGPDVTSGPTRALASFGAAAVDVGDYFSCAVSTAGEVHCWGSNAQDQLGAFASPSSDVPVRVDGVSGVAQVALGGSHGCARTDAGRVLCWGYDAYGQLGDGTGGGDGSVPVDVGLSDIVDVAAGTNHSCALDGSGQVYCWGYDRDGQLGNGGSSFSGPYSHATPQAIDMTDAIEIEAGGDSTCVVRRGGELWCWGKDVPGGGALDDQQAPIHVPGPTDVEEIAVGRGPTCVQQTDGAIYCWGTGVLPEGFSATPIPIESLGAASRLAAGETHVCAVADRGRVVCGGDDRFGLTGQGGSNASADGVVVVGAPFGAAEAGVQGNTGSFERDDPMVRFADGSIRLASRSLLAHVGARDLDTTRLHACAALATGEVACWGQGHRGQLGNGAFDAVPTPALVDGITDAWQVATGWYFSCALLQGGAVTCWGYNDQGQLGAESPEQSAVPLAVSGVADAVQVVAGDAHACARRSDGRIVCWGSNASGQLGIDSTATAAEPTEVVGIDSAIDVSAGRNHTCAALLTGEVRCWGDNTYYQLGNELVGRSTAPITVAGARDVARLGAGWDHQCAFDQVGRVACWGRNDEDQLGSTEPTQSGEPLPVPSLYGVRQARGASDTSCAVQGTEVYCWGLLGAPSLFP